MQRRSSTDPDAQSTGILSAQSRARWGAKPIATTETVESETRCVGKTAGNRIIDRNRKAGFTGQQEGAADVNGNLHEETVDVGNANICLLGLRFTVSGIADQEFGSMGGAWKVAVVLHLAWRGARSLLGRGVVNGTVNLNRMSVAAVGGQIGRPAFQVRRLYRQSFWRNAESCRVAMPSPSERFYLVLTGARWSSPRYPAMPTPAELQASMTIRRPGDLNAQCAGCLHFAAHPGLRRLKSPDSLGKLQIPSVRACVRTRACLCGGRKKMPSNA